MAIRGVQTKKVTELEAGTAIEDSHVIPVHDGTSLKGVPFSVIRNATGGGTGGGGGTGADGFSPVANVTKDGTVSTITITDKTGTTTVQVMDGEPGAPGIPGEKGETGATGATGPRGEQGVAGQDGKNFAISKIYDTSDDMMNDTIPLPDGVFVAVVSPAVNVYMRSRDTVAGGNDLAGYKFVLNLEEASVLRGEPGPQGPTGANGADGKNGTTPIKGIDYFTDADKQAFLNDIKKPLADGKKLVADAISAKGVTTAADADFAVMAANIDAIEGGGAEPDYSIVAENLANWGYRPDPVNSNTINDKVNEMYEATGTYLGDLYTACAVNGISANSKSLKDITDRIEDISFFLAGSGKNWAWVESGIAPTTSYAGTSFEYGGDTYVHVGARTTTSGINKIYKVDGEQWTESGVGAVNGLGFHSMFSIQGEVFSLGGYDFVRKSWVTRTYKSNDLTSWSVVASIPNSSVGSYATIIENDVVYYLGGNSSVYRSENACLSWTKVSDTGVRRPIAFIKFNTKYVIIGGAAANAVYESEDLMSWSQISTIPTDVTYCSLVRTYDPDLQADVFIIAGSQSSQGTAYKTYDFKNWDQIDNLRNAGYGFTSYVMNNRVYLAGGVTSAVANPYGNLQYLSILSLPGANFIQTKKNYQESLYNAIVAKGATPASHTVEDLIAAINTL